jgi:hypothetical protein
VPTWRAKAQRSPTRVTVEFACLVFDDPNAIDRLDLDEPDEDRQLITASWATCSRRCVSWSAHGMTPAKWAWLRAEKNNQVWAEARADSAALQVEDRGAAGGRVRGVTNIREFARGSGARRFQNDQ